MAYPPPVIFERPKDAAVLLHSHERRPPAGDIIQSAITWGITLGFGWEILRYLNAGVWRWPETIFMSSALVLLCWGVFYFRRQWRRKP